MPTYYNNAKSSWLVWQLLIFPFQLFLSSASCFLFFFCRIHSEVIHSNKILYFLLFHSHVIFFFRFLFSVVVTWCGVSDSSCREYCRSKVFEQMVAYSGENKSRGRLELFVLDKRIKLKCHEGMESVVISG